MATEYKSKRRQQGAASLLMSVILLIAITLVVLSTAKTVLMDTKIAADNYRTAQAVAAATAAMDRAIGYFMAGGFDQVVNATGAAGKDGNVDYVLDDQIPTVASCQLPATTAFPLTLTDAGATQTTLARFYYVNTPTYDDDNNAGTAEIVNPCDSSPSTLTASSVAKGMVVAQGWSDDCTAVRTVSQCLSTFNLFDGGEGPQQPFVSKAGVGVFGNAKIINRYSNISMWAGGSDAVHGASYGTYLRPSNTEAVDYTDAELDSEDETTNTQLVSNRDAGNGVDVITDDPTLSSKTTSTVDLTDKNANQFFDMFFALTKSEVKNAAEIVAGGASLDGKKGLIWVDGNTNINGTDVIGSPTDEAILIIDGNLDKLNGATIYGIVYVTGTLEIAGNPIVKGSIVSENPAASTGAGTLTLVFKPWGGGGEAGTSFITGTGALVAGSWKDWN